VAREIMEFMVGCMVLIVGILTLNRVLKNGLMPSAPNHGFHFFDVSEA
jgi:hypothetical protein